MARVSRDSAPEVVDYGPAEDRTDHFDGTRSTVSAFKDHRNGRLSPIKGSPFPDHQMAPCWVEITPDGQFLFTVNTASGTISAYQIAANGALTPLPGSTPAGGLSVGAVDARLSRTVSCMSIRPRPTPSPHSPSTAAA